LGFDSRRSQFSLKIGTREVSLPSAAKFFLEKLGHANGSPFALSHLNFVQGLIREAALPEHRTYEVRAARGRFYRSTSVALSEAGCEYCPFFSTAKDIAFNEFAKR
jgi:hypothetical protein